VELGVPDSVIDELSLCEGVTSLRDRRRFALRAARQSRSAKAMAFLIG